MENDPDSEDASPLAEQKTRDDDARQLAKRIQIGGFVRREMERLGLTQGELAQRAGCDQTTISKIINAKHRVTEKTLSRILKALEVGADAISELPSPEFQAGTGGFRLRALVIRAVIAQAIPVDDSICARAFLNQKWNDAEFRDFYRSPNLEDAVWAGLVADGWFEMHQGRYRVRYDTRGHLRYFLTSYISHACSAIHRLHRTSDAERAESLSYLTSDLDALESAINSPELVVDCFESFNLSLAGGDRFFLCILSGFVRGMGFLMQTTTSQVALPNQYAEVVRPILDTLLNVLRRAVTELGASTDHTEWHTRVDEYIATMGDVLVLWKATVAEDDEASS